NLGAGGRKLLQHGQGRIVGGIGGIVDLIAQVVVCEKRLNFGNGKAFHAGYRDAFAVVGDVRQVRVKVKHTNQDQYRNSQDDVKQQPSQGIRLEGQSKISKAEFHYKRISSLKYI